MSVIIDGGANEDVVHGAGFAHLREHWALASFRRALGDDYVMATAQTLQYQTEFIIFVRSADAVVRDRIDWWQWSTADLAEEVAVIDSEIVAAESDMNGLAVDRELPRRLGVFGPETDWGYGDRESLRGWTVDNLRTAVSQTWGDRPAMAVTTARDLDGWGPNDDLRPFRGQGVTVRPASEGPVTVAGGGGITYCGWHFDYRDRRDLRAVDDLVTLLTLVARDNGAREAQGYEFDFRIGQFGERHVARGSDYLAVGIKCEPGSPVVRTAAVIDQLLESTRAVLRADIGVGDSRLAMGIDRHRLLRQARINQSIVQRLVLVNRAKLLGGEDPVLHSAERDSSELTAYAQYLLTLIDDMSVDVGTAA
ncbi:hypothetical protein [Nocardia fluminea]|uniref:hypothetical protein n=1 Tax=Nocardia fluminea TaxID=134984 RepID=UPI0033F0E3E7